MINVYSAFKTIYEFFYCVLLGPFGDTDLVKILSFRVKALAGTSKVKQLAFKA